VDDLLRELYEKAAQKVTEEFLWPELRRLGVPDPERYVIDYGHWGDDDGPGVSAGSAAAVDHREDAPATTVQDPVPADPVEILVEGGQDGDENGAGPVAGRSDRGAE
jgi:hypothetical protein